MQALMEVHCGQIRIRTRTRTQTRAVHALAQPLVLVHTRSSNLSPSKLPRYWYPSLVGPFIGATIWVGSLPIAAQSLRTIGPCWKVVYFMRLRSMTTSLAAY